MVYIEVDCLSKAIEENRVVALSSFQAVKEEEMANDQKSVAFASRAIGR